MMHRSSGELSSGLTGCGDSPSLGDLRGVVSAYLREPCSGTASRALTSYSSTCCIQLVSSVRIMHSVVQAEAGTCWMDCEIAVVLVLGVRMSGWGDGV